MSMINKKNKGVFEKGKRSSKRGTITYGSGSRKKNRGSGNRGGVGNAGIWDHKKGSAAKINEIRKQKTRETKKKIKRSLVITPEFLSSKKYCKRLLLKRIFIDTKTKEIRIYRDSLNKFKRNKENKLTNEGFLNKIGYKIFYDEKTLSSAK